MKKIASLLVCLLVLFSGVVSACAEEIVYPMEEGITLIQLREGGQQAFSRLFTLYYRDLVLYAGRYLPEQAACEDIVQDTFLKVWNLRDRLDIAVSLRVYLIGAVRN